jgi:hypothetical protein
VGSLAVVTLHGYPQTLRLMGILGLLWLGVLALPLDDPGIVALYALCYVLVIAGATGNALRKRLASPRAQTIPDYPGAHLTVAFGLCALALTICSGIGGFRGLPPAALLLLLWSCALVAVTAGYVVPAVALNALHGFVVAGAGALALVLYKFELNHLLTEKMGSAVNLLLFVVNATLTMLCVRRMFHLSEETFAYLPLTELTRSQYGKGSQRSIPELDSMPAALPSDRAPRLRYLELGLLPGRSSFLFLAGLVTTVVLVTRLSGAPTDLFLMGSFMPFAMVSGLGHVVPRFLMLPLARRELVANGLGAILLALLRVWCAVMLATTISDWSVPPVESLLESLALLLWLFGTLTLAMGAQARLRSMVVKAVFMIPLILVLGFVVALGFVFADDFLQAGAAAVPIPVRIALYFIGGAAMIGLSYRRWCNWEMD